MAGMTSDPLLELLSNYHPADSAERADLDRASALIRTVEDPWTQALSLHVTGSALVVHPPTKRVLLRWHARQQAWLQVGGHGDPGEIDPLAVALREAGEETGLPDLHPWPDSALVHLVVVPVAAKGDSGPHEHADLRFVLATSTPDDVRPEKPGAELRWLTVDDALALTSEDNLRETIRRVGVLLNR
ncbi:NUDIX hydrolase [Nakamurella panacisegetis]|uniref:NUDIX hydrolase n=1 Tax=Nakamurella panacisegetis TaxID=1090615 RepID=UPI00155FB6FA